MRLDAEMDGLAEEGLLACNVLLLLSKTKAQLKRGDQRALTGMQQIRVHREEQNRIQVSVRQHVPARTRHRPAQENNNYLAL